MAGEKTPSSELPVGGKKPEAKEDAPKGKAEAAREKLKDMGKKEENNFDTMPEKEKGKAALDSFSSLADLNSAVAKLVGGMKNKKTGGIRLADGRELLISRQGKFGGVQTYRAMTHEPGNKESINEVVVSSVGDILAHVETEKAEAKTKKVEMVEGHEIDKMRSLGQGPFTITDTGEENTYFTDGDGNKYAIKDPSESDLKKLEGEEKPKGKAEAAREKLKSMGKKDAPKDTASGLSSESQKRVADKTALFKEDPLAAHKKHLEHMEDVGNLSPEEHIATFEAVVANKEEIKSQIGKKHTVKELRNMMPHMAYGSSAKKEELVNNLYESLVHSFDLEPFLVRHGFGTTMEEAVGKKLKNVNADSFKEYSERKKKQRKENAAYRDQLIEKFKADKEADSKKQADQARRAEAASADPEVKELAARIASKEAEADRNAALNKIVRNKKMTQEQKIEKLQSDLGISEALAHKMFEPDFAGRVGVPAYVNSNLRQEISRLKKRKIGVEKESTTKTAEASFSADVGGKVIDNKEDDRIQLEFDGKPSSEMRRELKSNGFNWSPSIGVWQRKRTDNARSAVRRILGTDPFSSTEKGFSLSGAVSSLRKSQQEEKKKRFFSEIVAQRSNKG